MKMVLIPPGEFLMGSSEEEIEGLLKEVEETGDLEGYAERIASEGPQHKVRISRPFYLAAHELTVGQFKAFVEATGHKTVVESSDASGSGLVEVDGELQSARRPEFSWRNVGIEQTDQHPVANLVWDDAVAFCQWLREKEGSTYRLPTEAEWEFACRAGSTTRWFFGDDEAELQQYAWCASRGGNVAKPVGQLAANGFGLYDIYGNVWEMCSDSYSPDYYAVSPLDDPACSSSEAEHVTRGGAIEYKPWFVRSAARNSSYQRHGHLHLGFRPVMLIDPTDPKPTPKPPAEAPKPHTTTGTQAPPPAVAPFSPEQAKKHQQQWALHLGVPVEFSNSIGMRMVLIPPGEFVMGSSEEEIEALLKEAEETGGLERYGEIISSQGPLHRVRITKPFSLAACEVTVGQFRAFVEATGYKTNAETSDEGGIGADGKWSPESNWRNPGYEQTEDHPAAVISWRDALAFCEWLSEKEGTTYRLPTEAEWEYACRAGSTTRWSFGDNKEDLEQYAWYAHYRMINGGGYNTKAVGQKLPNGFGLFDMHGNLYEWCSDWFSTDPYRSSPVEDPEGPSTGTDRVVRGGSFAVEPWGASSASRFRYVPVHRFVGIGFRPVLIIDPADPPKPTPKPPAEE